MIISLPMLHSRKILLAKWWFLSVNCLWSLTVLHLIHLKHACESKLPNTKIVLTAFCRPLIPRTSTCTKHQLRLSFWPVTEIFNSHILHNSQQIVSRITIV